MITKPEKVSAECIGGPRCGERFEVDPRTTYLHIPSVLLFGAIDRYRLERRDGAWVLV